MDMATYIENNIVVSETSHIEYQIDLSGGKRYDSYIGMTNRVNHTGKYGFIQTGSMSG
jgi:hypothetical protein